MAPQAEPEPSPIDEAPSGPAPAPEPEPQPEEEPEIETETAPADAEEQPVETGTEPAPSEEEHPADSMLRDLDAASDGADEDAAGVEDGAEAGEDDLAGETAAAIVPGSEMAVTADAPAASQDEGADVAPTIDPVRPAGLSARPKDGGDDLTRIEGVGPRIQEVLNSFGIWHFEQIAGWDAANASWVDQELNFSGRVARQDWVGQAKRLQAAR